MEYIILDHEKYNGSYFRKGPNDYDYIEIGTNDWDVMSMTHSNLKGIIVEPIQRYLNNIPPNDNVKKVNCAISNNNKEDGFMYYIPPDVIEGENIVNCFRGMNKLDEFHMGHVSQNLTNFVVKEKCEVMTYFTLLNRYKINYVDFLKIDTEGHDCTIINNILDDLENYPKYILPRYIYFENNGLTPMDTRIETMYRLYKYGYIHIYTKDDNTFMYNCTNFYLHNLKKYNISLPTNNHLNNIVASKTHFFHDVHSYMTYGQIDLFINHLNLDVTKELKKSNIIWTTQEVTDYEKYYDKNKSLVNIVHGGGFIYSELLLKPKLNLIVKSINDYLFLKQQNTNNIGLFVGKYKSQEKMMIEIYNYRQNNFKKLDKFLMLNGFFNFNADAVKNTYYKLKKVYSIDLFGYDSELGWTDVLNNSPIENNVLSKYKFYLHLKGNGYLCNSVICAMMVGMPVIMSKDVYVNTLYSQFIPKELVILCDNDNITQINENELIPKLDYAISMSDEEYLELSKKVYVHSTFFREYFNFELKHLYYFMNNLL
jgi:hypothetical protein